MTKIFCAIDTPQVEAAAALAGKLKGAVAGLKLGLEFFVANGPAGVNRVRAAMEGAEFFLDLKLHDIPNTVAGAVRAAMQCRADFLTIHASGGLDMMRAAVTAAADEAKSTGIPAPKILAVTVLTALSDRDLEMVGQIGPSDEQVVRLARLAQGAGVQGVVCSPLEIRPLRAALSKDLLLVVPGIRPAGSAAGDQKRVMTPKEAASLGADYLVIGRPITEADDPRAAAGNMLA